jgi:hypothetical protein
MATRRTITSSLLLATCPISFNIALADQPVFSCGTNGVYWTGYGETTLIVNVLQYPKQRDWYECTVKCIWLGNSGQDIRFDCIGVVPPSRSPQPTQELFCARSLDASGGVHGSAKRYDRNCKIIPSPH